MIDALQLPILLKAIDFIFDEGHRILAERRERKRAEGSASPNEVQEPPAEIALPDPGRAAEAKQGLLTSKIDEILWQNHELEIQHLVRLLETYSRNYYLTKEQYAKWGSALVPPIIVHNMNEAENSMLETIKRLEAILSKVYEKDITPIK
jgi:hypothetical protein